MVTWDVPIFDGKHMMEASLNNSVWIVKWGRISIVAVTKGKTLRVFYCYLNLMQMIIPMGTLE